MFMDVISRYNSSFYGYANGDILFDNSLTKSLKYLQKYVNSDERMLIVGMRSNYKLQKGEYDNQIGTNM